MRGVLDAGRLATVAVDHRFRVFFALYFASIGIFFPYVALYLRDIGLSGGQIGLVLGSIPFTAFLVQPLWGLVSDIYRLRRSALVFACLGSSGVAALFGLAIDFRLLLPLALLLAVLHGPISPLATALALEHLERRQGQLGFGSLRLWGSIGFAVSAFLIGALILEPAPGLLLPLYSLILFALGLTAVTLPDARIHQTLSWRQGALLLRRQPDLVPFLLGCLLIGATLGVVNNYLAVYMEGIGSPGWVTGAALALAALLEVPLMARVERLRHRWSLGLLLVGGVAVLPVRWLLYAVIERPLLVLPTQALHSIAITALVVVGVLYVDQRFPRVWRGTVQALYAAMLYGLGPGLGTFAGGWLLGRAGMTPVWLASAGAALVGVLILGSTLSSRSGAVSDASGQGRPGGPFVAGTGD